MGCILLKLGKVLLKLVNLSTTELRVKWGQHQEWNSANHLVHATVLPRPPSLVYLCFHWTKILILIARVRVLQRTRRYSHFYQKLLLIWMVQIEKMKSRNIFVFCLIWMSLSILCFAAVSQWQTKYTQLPNQTLPGDLKF